MQIISIAITIILFLSLLTWIGLSIYQKIIEIKTKTKNKPQKGGE